jgi:hypothetical protein
MSFRTLLHFTCIPALLLLAYLSSAWAQPTIAHSIYLIGDAGKDTLPGPALRMLGRELEKDTTSTVIFLGDNVYQRGLEGKEGSEKFRVASLKLLAQLSQTDNHKGHVYWLPGNHDWKAGRWQGMETVKVEAPFVENYYRDHADIDNKNGPVFIPKDAFPGPTHVTFADSVHLIAIDIQWWLQSQLGHRTPRHEGMSRKQMTRKFLTDLDSLLAKATSAGGPVLIAAHHPLYSNGHHGAPKQPLRFMVNWVPPFQFFGLIGLNRALVQDIPQPRYKRIRNRILKVMDGYKDIIYVSGHDHNLQYIPKGENHHLVSGAGSKRSSLGRDRNGARFMDDRNYGFMRLDLMTDGTRKVHVFGHITGQVFHSFVLE